MITLREKLTEAFGGRANLAAAAEVSPRTVSRWKDAIPYDAQCRILRNAHKYGVFPALDMVAPELSAAHAEGLRAYSTKGI